MKILIAIILLFATEVALAKTCVEDSDCKAGQECSKPIGIRVHEGFCATKRPQLGARTGESCTSNASCDLGYSCTIDRRNKTGICERD